MTFRAVWLVVGLAGIAGCWEEPSYPYLVRDFEHEDWTICVFDEDPAGMEQDAGVDVPAQRPSS